MSQGRRYKKFLDLGSRRAIGKGLRELQERGLTASPVRQIEYQPFSYTGTCQYAGRLALVELRDGTRLVMFVTGHSSVDPKPWLPYWVDIKTSKGMLTLHRLEQCGVIFWAPRDGSSAHELTFQFWAGLVGRRRRKELINKGWEPFFFGVND